MTAFVRVTFTRSADAIDPIGVATWDDERGVLLQGFPASDVEIWREKGLILGPDIVVPIGAGLTFLSAIVRLYERSGRVGVSTAGFAPMSWDAIAATVKQG